MSSMKIAIENTTRHVSALTVRVDEPLSLTRKYNAEARLANIRTMKMKTTIFNGDSASGECSPAGAH
jgi:hypothetical protein